MKIPDLGYVGSDLRSLIRQASGFAKERDFDGIKKIYDESYPRDEEVDSRFPFADFVRWERI